MGNKVTNVSAKVMWRKIILLLFLVRPPLPTNRVYRAKLFPINDVVIRPEQKTAVK